MDKAKEKALSYENQLWESGYKDCGYSPSDISEAYENGYRQAEKDVLKDARWIELYEDTTWEMVDGFVHQNLDGAVRIIIIKK